MVLEVFYSNVLLLFVLFYFNNVSFHSFTNFFLLSQRSPVRTNDFDSSDDEESDVVENLTPFQVDW